MITTEFTVALKPIKSIRPYEKNPRKIPDEAIEAVAKSITTFGFRQPVVTDKDGVIIVGHTRWRAALRLGMTKVPVHVAENLSAEQVQAYRIADNSTNTLTDWDMEMLALELTDLPQYDFADYGLDLDGLAPASIATEDEFDVDAAVAKVKVPRSKPGDVWACGKHRVMCGDSTKPEDLARLMDGGAADLVWTDPPYNVAIVGGNHALTPEERKTKGGQTIENDTMSAAQFSEFLGLVFAGMFTVTKPGGVFYVSTPPGPTNAIFQVCVQDTGWLLKQSLVWLKDVFVMGRQDYHWQHESILYGWKPGGGHRWFADRRQSTVLRFDRPKVSEAHPTMKPVALVGYCIGNSSRKGNVVLDPFGGSGTTLVAAEQMSREARLMEVDAIYCDVVVGRWEQLTGQTASR